MGKICQRCGLPVGVVPLHQGCAERARDYYRVCRGFRRPTLDAGTIRNAVRAREQWETYLEWENARLMLLGKYAPDLSFAARLARKIAAGKCPWQEGGDVGWPPKFDSGTGKELLDEVAKTHADG